MEYNIKAPFTLKLGQLRNGDVGFVGAGNWKRTRKGFFTDPERLVLPEDDTHVVMVEKTAKGMFCKPVAWMMDLVVERLSDIPNTWVKFQIITN